jgi:hypothetical protein
MSASLLRLSIVLSLCVMHTMQMPTQVAKQEKEPGLRPTLRLIKTFGGPSSKSKTLSELVNKRPSEYKVGRFKRFNSLFANHHKVIKLDRCLDDIEALKKGWTALRNEEKGLYLPQKMEQAIIHHLKTVRGLREDVVESVKSHWRADARRREVRRPRAKAKDDVVKTIGVRQQQKKEEERNDKIQQLLDANPKWYSASNL